MISVDGGPAFPIVQEYRGYDGCWAGFETIGGMSLRDWFAGQALIGLLAKDWYSPTMAAEGAYSIADAMLAARVKE